jgi:hypothetical protein
MDELQISGKRFISSRRIAKDNGYHTDYIGQLIRGGKIKGQKVGRTWYVDEASFAAYLGEESTVPAETVSESEPEPVVVADAPVAEVAESIVEEVPVSVVEEMEEENTPVETEQKEEEVVEEETKIPVHIEIKKEEIVSPVVLVSEEKKEVAVPTVIALRKTSAASGGLKYFSDDEPLLPEIAHKESVSRVASDEIEGESAKEIKIQNTHTTRRPRAGRIVFALAAAGAVVFVFSAVLSSAVFESINIQAGNSASVGYGVQW